MYDDHDILLNSINSMVVQSLAVLAS